MNWRGIFLADDSVMSTALIFILILLGASVLAGLASFVLYLIAGFREGVGWGIAQFLPCGSLIFTICRWEQAKFAFLASVISCLLAFAAFDTFRRNLESGLPHDFAALKEMAERKIGKNKPIDVSDLRDQELLLSEKVSTEETELKPIYAELLKQRESLSANDQKGIRSFNKRAAVYTERNKQLAAEREQLKAVREEITRVLDKQAASGNGNAAADNSPRVIIYSTSWCGPCKMAKAYLKKRGVPFEEVDVEKSREGAERFRQLGGGGVPLIVINGKSVRGFNQQRVDELLEES